MNDSEIAEAVKNDFADLIKISDSHNSMYRRAVIKASRFPYYFPPIHKRLKSGNNWYFLYEAKSKRDRKEESRVSFICIVDSPKGLFGIMPTFTDGKFHVILYSPHFFSRYAERFGVSKTGRELILHFFKKNYNYSYHFNRKFVNETQYLEEIFGACEEGVALGVSTTFGNVFFRTFITEEMLKGSQVATFLECSNIRKEIHESL